MVYNRSQSFLSFLPIVVFYSLALTNLSQSIGQHPHPDELKRKTQVTFKRTESGVEVQIGEELFTCLDTKRFSRPICYPIFAPGQIGMTRNWPMKSGSREPQDHPHHQSMWIGHFINGIDFWTQAGGREQIRDIQLDPERSRLVVHSDWVSHSGQQICSTESSYTFGSADLYRANPMRWIRVTITFSSREHDLQFEDTKEGMFAIRTHPNLQLTPAKEAGPNAPFGTASNSEGIQGKEIWGKKARWVLYQGEIHGAPVAVAMFDHPSNLRHPTTWHARDYGLIAANPFGLHEFLGASVGEGAHKITKGDKLTLTFQALFIRGKPNVSDVERWYTEFAD